MTRLRKYTAMKNTFTQSYIWISDALCVRGLSPLMVTPVTSFGLVYSRGICMTSLPS